MMCVITIGGTGWDMVGDGGIRTVRRSCSIKYTLQGGPEVIRIKLRFPEDFVKLHPLQRVWHALPLFHYLNYNSKDYLYWMMLIVRYLARFLLKNRNS